MFAKEIYQTRRQILKEKFSTGLLLFLGNEESPMNYAANTYPFRQDSTFLYYWGIDLPSLAAIIDIDANREILFGNDFSVNDIVWMGPQPTLKELAEQAGVSKTRPLAKLSEEIQKAIERKRPIHFLPQYRAENFQKMEELLGIRPSVLNKYASVDFIRAVVEQRSFKSEEEIQEIEKALEVTREIHLLAMHETRPGRYEREIAGAMEGLALSRGYRLSFPPIFSIHGEILHNPHHENRMEAGHLVVNDCGAETPERYAGDITRTLPVSGSFTTRQKEVYQIVMNSQLSAIEAMRPGVQYKDIHLLAVRKIVEGLQALGLMQGDPQEAVENGAHALFFPHGLGHMMGLDVHDMENLGEEYVGYDEKVRRSKQFGLSYLRFAKELQPGHVLTVEPGIYFIPALIDSWEAEKKLAQFIRYERLSAFRDFGGIRIEDNVLITPEGHRLLGEPIPKTIEEVEREMQK